MMLSFLFFKNNLNAFRLVAFELELNSFKVSKLHENHRTRTGSDSSRISGNKTYCVITGSHFFLANTLFLIRF